MTYSGEIRKGRFTTEGAESTEGGGWIPACAGMTVWVSGEGEKRRGGFLATADAASEGEEGEGEADGGHSSYGGEAFGEGLDVPADGD